MYVLAVKAQRQTDGGHFQNAYYIPSGLFLSIVFVPSLISEMTNCQIFMRTL